MDSIYHTWPWYVAGPLIGLFVPFLLYFHNKQFGISSSFEHLCSLIIPAKAGGLNRSATSKHGWKSLFVLGIFIGAFLSEKYLSASTLVFLPAGYYSVRGIIFLFIGGLLVGFGTRYASGCTSGHAITGLSLLSVGSLKSTMAFFCGGLAYTFIVVYLVP